MQLGLGLVASGTSPSKAVARAELRERMRQTLDLLKQADREILWMRHYDQLSFPEAAQILGLSESAATLRYVRAVKRLKKLWQDLYPDESGNFPLKEGPCASNHLPRIGTTNILCQASHRPKGTYVLSLIHLLQ